MEIVRRDRVNFGTISNYTQFVDDNDVLLTGVYTKIPEATVVEDGMERTINAVGFDGSLAQFSPTAQVQILPIKVLVG